MVKQITRISFSVLPLWASVSACIYFAIFHSQLGAESTTFALKCKVNSELHSPDGKVFRRNLSGKNTQPSLDQSNLQGGESIILYHVITKKNHPGCHQAFFNYACRSAGSP